MFDLDFLCENVVVDDKTINCKFRSNAVKTKLKFIGGIPTTHVLVCRMELGALQTLGHCLRRRFAGCTAPPPRPGVLYLHHCSQSVRIVICFAVAMIILSFLCTGIRAVNQEDLDSKEVPEMP